MALGLTIRQTAARLGIHPSTAFRWRHKLLAQLTQREKPLLSGVVEVVDMRIPESFKGQHWLPRGSRRSGVSLVHKLYRDPAFLDRRLCVVLARDREGHSLTEIDGQPRPTIYTLNTSLWPRLVKGSVVCTKHLNWYMNFCRRSGLVHEIIRESWPVDLNQPYHLRNVLALQQRLKGWLDHFRGVASKYLERYLAWFNFLDGTGCASREMAGQQLLAEATNLIPARVA